MQSGNLTVTGNDLTIIPLRGKPRNVEVHFKFEKHHHPCNPHHHDHLHWSIRYEDEDPHMHRRLDHHHHDRLFFLIIEWEVESVREIDWFVMY